MPGGIFSADTGFPNVEKGSTEEKLSAIVGYLYQLLEQLRYTLNNLGTENFNGAELESLGKTLTEPLSLIVKDVEGDLAKVMLEADSISSKLSDVEGNVSEISQKASGIESRVASLDGSFSKVKQTVDGLQVTTEKGATFISGDHVKSGTITGTVLQSVLEGSDNASKGRMEMVYKPDNETSFAVGGIWLDCNGAGNAAENQYRMFAGTIPGTENKSGMDFSLKLQSAGSSSYISKTGDIWISVPKGKRIVLKTGDTQWRFYEDKLMAGDKTVARIS